MHAARKWQRPLDNAGGETSRANAGNGPEWLTTIPASRSAHDARSALSLCAQIGGVMIMGDRGTGKSTTIRALADLLPEIRVVDRDPFNSGEWPKYVVYYMYLHIRYDTHYSCGTQYSCMWRLWVHTTWRASEHGVVRPATS
jgi:hypothetical protein